MNNKIGVKKYIDNEILDNVAYLREVSEIRIIKKIDKNIYLLILSKLGLYFPDVNK
tara:strand:+ start:1340 stop:1507 length:168 start_codon:yes stop_codon:yes gene_type:complete